MANFEIKLHDDDFASVNERSLPRIKSYWSNPSIFTYTDPTLKRDASKILQTNEFIKNTHFKRE